MGGLAVDLFFQDMYIYVRGFGKEGKDAQSNMARKALEREVRVGRRTYAKELSGCDCDAPKVMAELETLGR